MIKNPNSPLVETSNTIESKFDTPGPGTYNIKGYFYKKDRNSTQMNNNRFKGQQAVSDTLMTTSGNGTERSIS
jgi:hypothetical protein